MNFISIFFNIFQRFSTELSNSFLFIFLKVFVQNFLFQENFFDKKLVLFIFIHFSLCQKNRKTNCLNSFVSLISLCQKNRRTNRLNSFVSLFSLDKRFKGLTAWDIFCFPLQRFKGLIAWEFFVPTHWRVHLLSYQ